MAEGVLQGRRVLLLIVGHLANAPRARKAAGALVDAGASVVVRGVWADASRVDEDRALAAALGIDFQPLCDLRPVGGSIVDRLRQRAASLASRVGMHGPRLLGPGAPEALREARRLRCDLTIAHGEPGLWAVERLAREGLCVGVDFEDWFSHDQPDADRPAHLRHTLRTLERTLLRDASYVSTTTAALSDALALDAGAQRLPLVIPNCFDFSDAPDPAPATQTLRLHWVSQTVGPGRGLEVLADALDRLRGDWTLTLRGALHGHADWYAHTFGERHGERVERLDPVSADALAQATACHDIGLALEIPYCRNKDLTASNKLFDYLRCGLAVIATDTAGQREVLAQGPRAGWTVPAGDAAALARVLQDCIDNRAAVAQARVNARLAAREHWDFSRFAPRIVQGVAAALTVRA